MGTTTFATKSPGDIISSADPNQYKSGLVGDHVPRNASGVPTDLAGGLGSTLYRWASSYIKRIYVGTAAEEVWIDGTGTVFRVGIGTVTKMQVGTEGLVGSVSSAPGTWILSMFTSTERPVLRCATFFSSGNFTAPTDGTNVIIWASGGGGGGGAGGRADNPGQAGGGGGGAGAKPELVCVQNLTAGSVYAVSIGGGGTAGTAPGSGVGTAHGGAGGSGDPTTFGGTLAVWPGAPGGSGGLHGSSGTGGSGGGASYTGVLSNPGGAGSSSGSGAGNGVRSVLAEAGNGNGGGGSGAGFGPGTNAGANGNPGGSLSDGTAPAANSGAGGSGGGGGTNSNQSGAAGGAGGSGRMYIFWWGKQT